MLALNVENYRTWLEGMGPEDVLIRPDQFKFDCTTSGAKAFFNSVLLLDSG